MPSAGRTLVLATALAGQMWMPASAVAQPRPGEEPATPEEGALAAPSASGKRQVLEEITVTGSRIRRKDLTTPAPVAVITREQLTASGKVSIGDFLQSLPEQGNAINTNYDNGGDGSTRISLRSLGVQRTLVLLNGRRMVPGGTGADGSVDLNSIPAAAVERIEVLKDGASAVYGSDAIAGVVNIITRRNLDGTEVSGYAGTTARGDGRVYDVSATTGTSGERGSILLSAGFTRQQPIFSGSRAFSAVPTAFDATGLTSPSGSPGTYTFGGPWVPAGNFTIPGAPGQPLDNPTSDPKIAFYNTLVTTYPTATTFIRDPGSPLGWRPFVNSLPTGAAGGDAYNYLPPNYLVTPQQRVSLFSTGDVSLGGHARGYFEASYVNRQSDQQLAPEIFDSGFSGITVSARNQYNPFGVDVTSAQRALVEFGNRRFSQDIDTFRAVVGVDGSLPGWAGPLASAFWDLSLNYGRVQAIQLTAGSLRAPKLRDALGPSANGQCLDAAGNAIPGCVPLDLFGGAGSISPDQIAGLAFTGAQRGTNQLLALQANASADLFRLWADRPVGLALGWEYRSLQGSQIPDPITAAGESTGNAVTPTAGRYHVNEGYAELSVPVASHLPFAESIEAMAAARAFAYSTFGSDWTYKLGGRWSVVRDLTFRGTYSTAFRAPSIADLYLGQQDNFPAVSDPCADAATAPASCPAAAVGNGDTRTQLRSKIGGNPLLQPETADIFTLGVVLEPRWVKNLTLTVDYYQIHISRTISAIGEATILNGCYPSTGTPDQAFCDRIARDPLSQQITNIDNLNANIGKEATSGIDLALRYALPIRGVGRFAFAFDGTWLRKHDILLADGRTISGRGNFDLNGTDGNFGGFGGVNPAWKFNAGLQWALQGFGAGLQTRFVGSFKECGDSAGDFSGLGQCYVDGTYQRKVDAYSQWDAFLSYTVPGAAGRTSFAIGVNNLFDARPPAIYNGFTAATDPTAYDFAGRFVYARISHGR
jgi:iron complex outermembrane recepter protein